MTTNLELRYVPLSTLERWDRNPKRHDIGSIVTSIGRYGFKDPMKYEPLLNDGRGGVVEGNGRTAALLWMKSADYDVPRGLRVDDDGEWLVPVLFGVDAETVAAAEAYGVDHNNITLLGGDARTLDIASMYDLPSYAALVQSLENRPVSVDRDDVELLARRVQQLAAADFLDDLMSDAPPEEQNEFESPYVGLLFPATTEQRDRAMSIVKHAADVYGVTSSTLALLAILEAWSADNG